MAEVNMAEVNMARDKLVQGKLDGVREVRRILS